uniref:Uncharacterized protein n=1 Tax=Aegilops tauschii subsp. strangulata TaxID=200361 RepID=A0A453KPC9_AEGTS
TGGASCGSATSPAAPSSAPSSTTSATNPTRTSSSPPPPATAPSRPSRCPPASPPPPPPTPPPSRPPPRWSTPSASSKRIAAPSTTPSSTTIRFSRCSSAAGMTATFGVGDGTRCRAAFCHSLCKGIMLNQYLTWLTLSMKALGVHGLQYQKIMPLQLANRMDLFSQQRVMHVLIAGMWESGKCKMTFKGHTDYLHSIAVREANHQGGNWIRRWDSPHLGLQKWEVYADDTSSTEQEN